ncbi:MAG TPA: transcriptional regulator [Terriglobales bacterium]|nr:transcriptional regulator [Terriglobales bacterium]
MAVKRATGSTEKYSAVRNRRSEEPRRLTSTVPDFDPLIHERMRLGILSALAVNQSLTFNDLKALLETTDGNLSVHARKLEDAAYVKCEKSFDGRTPRTTYQLSPLGKRSLERYLDHMEGLIKATRENR